MGRLGTVESLFRYPVKSMLGESVDRALVGPLGIADDRGWAVRDERRGDFFTAKRLGALMGCRGIGGQGGAVPEIELPDGTRFAADADEAAEQLSKALDHPVSLHRMGEAAPPPDEVETPEDPLADFNSMFARKDAEPVPDFSTTPESLMAHMTRPDRPFVDLAPLLVMTRQSIDTLAAAAPDSVMDDRRFRPSLLIDAESTDRFPEQAWIGRRLRIGSVLIDAPMTCPRCVMTTHGFADLPKDPKVMRNLVSEADGNLGIYGAIVEPGEIRVGDPVEAVEPE
ncbi:MAG: MOSC N-terminal beta barrel domain-containing protein [bacterium]|nr:MOSC N-terminal beta barrel domain-containing protein [bacterium]